MVLPDENAVDESSVIEKGMFASYTRNTKGVVESLDFLKNFTLRLIYLNITREHETDAKAVIIAIGDIGKITSENNMEVASVAVIRALEEITLAAAGQNRKALSVKAASVLGNFAKIVSGRGMDLAAKSAAESLLKLGKVSIKQKEEEEAGMSEIFLMRIAKEAFGQNLQEVAISAIDFLGELGKLSAENELENSAIGAELLLEELGFKAIFGKHGVEASVVIRALEKIGTAVQGRGRESIAVQAAWSLETIRLLAGKENMNAVAFEAKKMLESLETTGASDEGQTLEKIEEIKKFHQQILGKS